MNFHFGGQGGATILDAGFGWGNSETLSFTGAFPSRRYNSYVSRLLGLALAVGLGFAQGQLREREETPAEPEAPMVDEDEDLLPRTQYAFNPIQAKKDLKIGNFYARKGNHRAAAGRYLEATKWNPGYSEAYWRLGRSREKLKQPSDALAAYRRFLQLAPDDKRAKAVKGKIPLLERQVKAEPPARQEPSTAAPDPDRGPAG